MSPKNTVLFYKHENSILKQTYLGYESYPPAPGRGNDLLKP